MSTTDSTGPTSGADVPVMAWARHCEELLSVHEEAYESATGEEWDRLTRDDYESCSNRDGWPGLVG
ncbi:hypothetical protein ACFVHB_08785 [Kitasatospora sp. NPDC127111]|uniref:hypothetical protein n=1 Tax=Kitasatospora sp. NPDC127111 TaxID=3345363 RepID=UPI0036393958